MSDHSHAGQTVHDLKISGLGIISGGIPSAMMPFLFGLEMGNLTVLAVAGIYLVALAVGWMLAKQIDDSRESGQRVASSISYFFVCAGFIGPALGIIVGFGLASFF